MKTLKIMTNSIPRVGIGLLFIIFLIPSEIYSQSRLSKVTQNGMNMTTPVNIKIVFPKEKPQTVSIVVGSTITAGTIVLAPVATQLEFTSPSGNVVTMQPNSKLRLTAGANGETYTNYNGTVGFNVANKMSFFNVTDGRGKVILASKSTAYSMNVTKNVVSYNTTNGEINVFKKVPLRVGEDSKNEKRNDKQGLNTYSVASQSSFDNAVDVDVDAMDAEGFPTYEMAINASLQLIQFFEQSGSISLQLADEKSNLANLFLDDGRPEEAIQPLEEAINIYEQIDEYDPYVAEMTLDLAEAYMDAGYSNEGITVLNMAIDYLNEDMEFALLDFQESQADQDEDLIWSDANALIDIFENLSWAYELAGPEYSQESQYYEDQANILSSQY